MDSAIQTPVPEKLSTAERFDRWLAGPMFWLSAGFLVLAAGVIHRVGQQVHSYLEIQIIYWTTLIVWPLFLAEGIVRLVSVRPYGVGRRLAYLAVFVLLPPLRMGARSYADATKMWLPRWEFCTVDRHLRKRLERFFSVPMMIIALLVVPVLAVEYFWKEQIRAYFAAQLFLDIAESVIWMAFALEFILMISVADKKVRYCVQNWMDLAIVLLPLFDWLQLLRVLRLTQLLELQQVTRLGRIYRLRGLLVKFWRAILLLDVLYRLIGNAKERRLQRLKELLIVKQEEVADLCKEIEDLQRDLATAKASPPLPQELVPVAVTSEVPSATPQVSESQA